MTLTFTEKEKKAMAALNQQHCDPYLSRFPLPDFSLPLPSSSEISLFILACSFSC